MEFQPIKEDSVTRNDKRGHIAVLEDDVIPGRILAIVVWDDATEDDAPELIPLHKLRDPEPDVTPTAPFRIRWTVRP